MGMKFRAIAMMALAFARMDKLASKTLKDTGSYKEAFKGTMFQNVNVGNNPFYSPTRSQKIKSKRLAKINSNR